MRDDYKEAKKICNKLYKEYAATARCENTTIHLQEHVRQRPNQQFEGHEEYSLQVDSETGWKYYIHTTMGSSFSSSSWWRPSDSWWPYDCARHVLKVNRCLRVPCCRVDRPRTSQPSVRRGVLHPCAESKAENITASIANCRTLHCQSRILQLAFLMSLLLRRLALLSGYC